MAAPLPDFCPEGCYWNCEHRTVEDHLRRAFEPSEATREALATIDATDISVDGTRYIGAIDWGKPDDPGSVVFGYQYGDRLHIPPETRLPKPGDEPGSMHVWKDQR